jgi:anti-anti-sigma factor
MSHRTLKILDRRGAQVPKLPVGMVLDDASIGRIEEWVVSTLDDRAKHSGETDWMASLDGLTLTKRSPQTKRNSGTTSSEPVGWARFRLSKRRGIAIVSLTDQALIKEEDLHELTGDLRALVEAGHRRIVLDFFAVERLSSWAASVIDETVRHCGSLEGSAVKFSGLKPEVAMIFAMTGLDPRVAIYPDTAAAVGSVWPDLPVLRPLPVSILTALMRAEEKRTTPSFRSLSTGRLDEDHPAMNPARLIVQDGRSAGKPVAIKGVKFVIGRGPDCDLRVRSATVSRSHASIERRGSRLFLRDLASTNGTILNGRTLRDREAEIRDGDTLRFGKMSFTLNIGRAAETVVLRDDMLQDLYRSDDRGLSTLAGNHDDTEEFLDLSELGQEIGLKYEVIEDVLVVTPLTADLDDEADVDAFRDALISLSIRRVPNRVVINLTNLGHISGRAIGVLVAHHLRLDRSGGALRVCLANPRVAVVLEQIKLGMLVDYHQTVEDAVIAAWPEPVAGANRG